MKGKCYRFVTSDLRVLNFYAEKYPWISAQFPAKLSRRSAVSLELHNIITKSAVDGTGSHRVESTLRENRCVESSRNMLIFYSLQSLMMKRDHPFFNRNKEETEKSQEFKYHFDSSISVVSDNYITNTLTDYYNDIERYLLLFFEQRVYFEEEDVASLDHNMKRCWKMCHQGLRMFNYCFRAMNSWGGIVWSVNANSSSMGDPDVVDAAKRQRAAVKAAFNWPEPSCKGSRVLVYVDKPNQDGPGACRLFGCDGDGNQAQDQLIFRGRPPSNTHPLTEHPLCMRAEHSPFPQE